MVRHTLRRVTIALKRYRSGCTDPMVSDNTAQTDDGSCAIWTVPPAHWRRNPVGGRFDQLVLNSNRSALMR